MSAPTADPATADAVDAAPADTTEAEGPAWARPALVALLAATGALYLWQLSANGWANEFYAAAAQAGSTSWEAFLFGSSDAGNTITVDKPPASLWPSAIAVRAFGLSPWSILVPQALMGVATVAVVHAAVRRHFGAAAGLMAGAALALTPVAALMFRYNNPDALLTLLLAISAYTALRAIDDDRGRWYALTGAAIGLAFLTKQLQAFLVVPGLALALLASGASPVRRRLRWLLVAGLALVAAAGWWVALVELWPDGSRPYIGGSTNNSFLDLTFGYNGLGRITGDGNAPGGIGAGMPGGGGGPFGAGAGIDRLVTDVTATQAAWLLPAAAVALVAGLVATWHRPRTDPQRASLLVWGTWLLTTAAVFSVMDGIFHEYYTVALSPAIAALAGIGATFAWRHRSSPTALACTAAAVGGSTWWANDLLGLAPDWNPWLRTTVNVAGGASTAAVAALAALRVRRHAPPRAAPAVAAALAAVALLAGPLAWTLHTVGTGYSGSIVTAGPATATAGMSFPAPGDLAAEFGGGDLPLPPGAGAEDPPTDRFPGSGTLPGAGGAPGGGGFPGRGGGMPGMGAGAEPSQEAQDRLTEDSDHYDWVAATTSATAAAPYQLATEQAVLPIGGFSGSDPAPTLDEFQQYVEDGRIHWFITGPGAGAAGIPGDPETTEGRRIATWVTETYEAIDIDGVTLYDLTTPQEA